MENAGAEYLYVHLIYFSLSMNGKSISNRYLRYALALGRGKGKVPGRETVMSA
jgi:hypothetical protein